MAEDWKLQVSYKTGTGDLINVRANTADELSVLLEGIGDFAQHVSTERGSTSRESPARRGILTQCGSARCLRAQTNASQ